MSFAMKLEDRARSFYENDTELPADLREDLMKDSLKRHRRIEKARREGVVELALEAISGLDGADYAVEHEGKAGLAGTLQGAIVLEEACGRFYREASLKLPMQDMARLFMRCAKSNEENLVRLRALPKGR